MFKNTLFLLFKTVMIFIKYGFYFLYIEIVPGTFIPRNGNQPVEIVAYHS